MGHPIGNGGHDVVDPYSNGNKFLAGRWRYFCR